jgi:hypothetical protein
VTITPGSALPGGLVPLVPVWHQVYAAFGGYLLSLLDTTVSVAAVKRLRGSFQPSSRTRGKTINGSPPGWLGKRTPSFGMPTAHTQIR